MEDRGGVVVGEGIWKWGKNHRMEDELLLEDIIGS